MLKLAATRTGKKGPISKKTFLYISVPLFCTTTTRNFLVTRFMKELCSQKICCFVSVRFFFSLPLIFTLLAASISRKKKKDLKRFLVTVQTDQSLFLNKTELQLLYMFHCTVIYVLIHYLPFKNFAVCYFFPIIRTPNIA